MDSALWWGMPAPQYFIRTVLDHLRDGRSTVVVFPRHHPHGFLDALQRAQERWGISRWTSHRLPSEELESDTRSPARLLHELAAPLCDAGALPSAESLVQNDAFRYRLFLLEFGESGSWDAWCRFLQQYGQVSKTLDRGERSVFCAVVKGASGRLLPLTDVTLAVLPWSGTVTHLDMQLYASYLLSEVDAPPLVRFTQVAVIASLAGTDSRLVDALASCDLDTLFDPAEVLRNYALSLGWAGDQPAEMEHEAGIRDRLDGGEILHSAVVAVRGDNREIARRVWRGQVSEVLPYLEVQRCRLIDVVRSYLPQPPWNDGYEMISDLYDLELRSIWYFLRRGGAPRTLVQKSSQLRNARNALSHLEPISAAELRDLARLRFS